MGSEVADLMETVNALDNAVMILSRHHEALLQTESMPADFKSAAKKLLQNKGIQAQATLKPDFVMTLERRKSERSNLYIRFCVMVLLLEYFDSMKCNQ